MKPFGKHSIINIYDCNDRISSVEKVKEFLRQLTKEIDMMPFGEPQVYRFAEGSLEGVSGIQFIMTSSILIHCDEIHNRAFIDVFSCAEFNEEEANKFCKKFFGSTRSEILTLPR